MIGGGRFLKFVLLALLLYLAITNISMVLVMGGILLIIFMWYAIYMAEAER
jgi:hypothetical protein